MTNPPRTPAGWRQLTDRHQRRIERLRRVVKNEHYYAVAMRRKDYLMDIDHVEAWAENKARDLTDDREIGIVWEQAVADLLQLAHDYWAKNHYCETGWRVANRALGSKLVARKRWDLSIYLLGEQIDAAKREAFEEKLKDFIRSELPGFETYGAPRQILNERYTTGSHVEYPLRSGVVHGP